MNPIKGSTVKIDPDSLQNVINKTVVARGRKEERKIKLKRRERKGKLSLFLFKHHAVKT